MHNKKYEEAGERVEAQNIDSPKDLYEVFYNNIIKKEPPRDPIIIEHPFYNNKDGDFRLALYDTGKIELYAYCKSGDIVSIQLSPGDGEIYKWAVNKFKKYLDSLKSKNTNI